MTFLLIGIFTSAEALGDDNHTNENMYNSNNGGGITELNLDFITLINTIKGKMPLTYQKIIDLGFELKSSRISSLGVKITKVNPVKLKDGIILGLITLREDPEAPDKNTLFTLTVKTRNVTRDKISRKLGTPMLVSEPRGHSANELFVYSINVDKFRILLSYTQQDPDILKMILFDSTE